MRRGTTPKITINVSGADLSAANVYLTLQQSATQVTFTEEDLIITPTDAGCKIEVTLTQLQTMNLATGAVMLQLRWVEADGTAHASNITTLNVESILLNEVTSYAE